MGVLEADRVMVALLEGARVIDGIYAALQGSHPMLVRIVNDSVVALSDYEGRRWNDLVDPKTVAEYNELVPLSLIIGPRQKIGS